MSAVTVHVPEQGTVSATEKFDVVDDIAPERLPLTAPESIEKEPEALGPFCTIVNDKRCVPEELEYGPVYVPAIRGASAVGMGVGFESCDFLQPAKSNTESRNAFFTKAPSTSFSTGNNKATYHPG